MEAISEVLDSIFFRITVEMNSRRVTSFTEAKIKSALMDMHPSKLLGSSGFLALFFQKYWNSISSLLV